MLDYKACVIIPVYNHHKQIRKIVSSINQLAITCILFDDGSEANCKETLERVSTEISNVQLFRFDQNQGKGKVVVEGLKKAYELGFTHAIQIDADGQHDTKEIPKFIQLSKDFPTAVVSAKRDYNDLPSNRRYGRMFTDAWVWIHTWSTQIKDSMCGFRLYPLEHTNKLLQKHNICQRMDFDTDILVRLYWYGLDVKHVPIKIHYGTEIISHFDLVKDNVRITIMHTRLFFGMLVRIPWLIARIFYGNIK